MTGPVVAGHQHTVPIPQRPHAARSPPSRSSLRTLAEQARQARDHCVPPRLRRKQGLPGNPLAFRRARRRPPWHRRPRMGIRSPQLAAVFTQPRTHELPTMRRRPNITGRKRAIEPSRTSGKGQAEMLSSTEGRVHRDHGRRVRYGSPRLGDARAVSWCAQLERRLSSTSAPGRSAGCSGRTSILSRWTASSLRTSIRIIQWTSSPPLRHGPWHRGAYATAPHHGPRTFSGVLGIRQERLGPVDFRRPHARLRATPRLPIPHRARRLPALVGPGQTPPREHLLQTRCGRRRVRVHRRHRVQPVRRRTGA